MRLPRLYPILDAELAAAHGHDLVAVAGELHALGCTVQQLRAKRLAGGAMLALARALRPVVGELIVNDRADIARLAGAAGLHLGIDDLPAAAARRLLTPGMRLGLSTHRPDQVAAAAAEQPDYLAIGPVFATQNKANPDPVVGLEGVAMARRGWSGPLVAIGGITQANCAAVIAAGADAVAVIGALWAEPQPAAAAAALLKVLSRLP